MASVVRGADCSLTHCQRRILRPQANLISRTAARGEIAFAASVLVPFLVDHFPVAARAGDFGGPLTWRSFGSRQISALSCLWASRLLSLWLLSEKKPRSALLS